MQLRDSIRNRAGTAASGGTGMPRDMRALTALRALLAWWVVLFHTVPLAPFRLSQTSPLIAKGPILVDCFFVLSGFVLFHMHARAFDAAGWGRAAAGFLVARLARLYPVHLVVLAGFLALIGGLHVAIGFHPNQPALFTAGALAAQFLLLNGFAVACGGWNFPSWSISSECVAYLCAPALFRLLSATSDRMRRCALAALVVTVLACVEFGRFAPFGMAIPRVLLEFCLGALMRDFAGAAFAALCRIRTAALLAGWLAIALSAPFGHNGLFLAAVLWTMLFLSLTPGWQGRLGNMAAYLGESSYAVYMSHALILAVWSGLAARAHLAPIIAPIIAPLAAAILLAVAIQGAASLLHRFIEAPGRSAIRSLGDALLAPRRHAVSGQPMQGA